MTTTALTKTKRAGDMIEKMKSQLDRVLGTAIPADRFTRICLSMVNKTPKLADCSPQTLLGAIMECAQLGLEPGVNGDAWVIPYGRDATLVIGYKGLTRLAYRSGMVASFAAAAVYEGDDFDWRLGTDPMIRHQPRQHTRDPEKLTHAYCVIKTTTGGTLFEVVTRAEILDVKNRSRAGRNGPWVTDFEAMAKKTAVRRAAKLAPSDANLSRAVDLDERAEFGHAQGLDFDVRSLEDDSDVIDVESRPSHADLDAQAARESA